jgi:hypothetical protein
MVPFAPDIITINSEKYQQDQQDNSLLRQISAGNSTMIMWRVVSDFICIELRKEDNVANPMGNRLSRSSTLSMALWKSKISVALIVSQIYDAPWRHAFRLKVQEDASQRHRDILQR